jgi:hypothetical protein
VERNVNLWERGGADLPFASHASAAPDPPPHYSFPLGAAATKALNITQASPFLLLLLCPFPLLQVSDQVAGKSGELSGASESSCAIALPQFFSTSAPSPSHSPPSLCSLAPLLLPTPPDNHALTRTHARTHTHTHCIRSLTVGLLLSLSDGLIAGHAYGVMRLCTVGTARLFQIRNPHGFNFLDFFSYFPPPSVLPCLFCPPLALSFFIPPLVATYPRHTRFLHITFASRRIRT